MARRIAIFTFLFLFGSTTSTWAIDNGAKHMNEKADEIVLGGGCFWCIEAVLQLFRGIVAVESGYAGGAIQNPTYEEVSSGTTGHAEVVKVRFDPSVISLKEVLTIFFHAHDPTTLNRQGNDVGTQYRSVILYKNDEQRQISETVKKEISDNHVWENKVIVTEIKPLGEYYSAEEYHQDYYQRNKSKGYCAIVIAPKIEKVSKEFEKLLKE